MTYAEFQYKSCTKKQPYFSKAKARMVASEHNHHLDDDRPLTAYKCVFGRHYHIGHRPLRTKGR